MKIDVATLYFLIIGTLFVSSAMTYWEHVSHPKRAKELRLLAAAYATLALGCAFAALRGELLGAAGAALSNLVILGGYVLVLNGVASFSGRRYLVSSIGLLLLMAAGWAIAGTRWQIAVWLYFSAFPIAVASVLTSFELMRSKMPAVQSRHVAVAVTALHALCYAARAFVMPWFVPKYGQHLLLVASEFTMYEGVLYSVVMPMTLLRLTREEIHGELWQESRTDYLTRLGNRKLFFEEGECAIAECAKRRVPASLLAFDLDHFKRINDRYGHKTGDDVLRAFAQTLRATTGADAVLARIGGEEFAALLPGTDSARAVLIGEGVASQFAMLSHRAGGDAIRATVSVGLASSLLSTVSLADLLSIADRGLYRAKSLGGNRLEQTPSILPAAL